MISSLVLLIKLILAHLLTDFVLQPKTWVEQRGIKHFASGKLYLHGFITGGLAWIFTGFQYWQIAIVIFITHIIIDGWKSYRKPTAFYFLADQLLHLLVILICWYWAFVPWSAVTDLWLKLKDDLLVWKTITAFVFVTAPAGIFIGQLTKQWRDKLPEAENLANAGKWIGMVERTIILVFVYYGQYSAIGLLVAAKGIIRFNEKDRQEIKTEYLVIGTLMSIGLAIISGLLLKL